ncbi:PrpF family protein [Meredithblackwellia eburnea MCA 4105]
MQLLSKSSYLVLRSAARKLSTSTITRRQACLPASFYRGGTSKAVMVLKEDLPNDEKEWNPIFLSLMGSPDPDGRQLNGMGGGLSSVSKVAVVSKSSRKDADVDYTFVQIGIKDTVVDYASNCGNILSAVGPFSMEQGLFSPTDISSGQAVARIFNTNTNKVIHSTFPVSAPSTPKLDGDFSIDGVPGEGSRITLDFINPGGAKTGKLLPSGNAIDLVDSTTVPGYEGPRINTTLVDCGNPCVFVDPRSLNISPEVLPSELEKNETALSTLESVRRAGAVLMGMAKDVHMVAKTVPKICLISPRFDYKSTSYEVIGSSTIDLAARVISSGDPHRACPITTGLCIAAAAKIPGTLVRNSLEVRGNRADPVGIVIGHPSGRLSVSAEILEQGGVAVATKATVFRTARKLFEGSVFYEA